MKILVALPRFPYPLEKGDKLRAYNQIKELSKNNEIYLFCVSHTKVLPEHVEQLRPYCQDICCVSSPKLVNYKNIVRNYLHTKSLQIGYWDSRKARKAVKEFVRKVQPDVIYSQMVRTMPWISRLPYPKVMDYQDALSMNTERRMDQTRGLWHYILHFEFKMLRSTEYNAFKIFDALTIISEPDSDAIPRPKNGEIHIIPNGVDFDFFDRTKIPSPAGAAPKWDIVFCGNMGYEPNVHAAQYLVKEVMPLVWKEVPGATVLLAGANPKHGVSNLASDKVSVSGYVADIRECYAASSIFVAPMLTGSGLQNKLLEAMAMQLPCVTTSIANDSLGARDGSEVLIGDNAEAFAAHIVSLLRDADKRASLAQSGRQYALDHFSWETSCQQLEAVLKSVVNNEY